MIRGPHPPGGGGGWGGYLGGWKWSGDLLDDMGMTGTMWGWRGRRGDDRDNMGGDNGDDGDHMGTFWGLWGWCGDNGDDTGMTWATRGRWGPCGDHRDNKITKNAITFEQIEIIEFRLKFWDPWAPPTHIHCSWCIAGGCPIPNDSFI